MANRMECGSNRSFRTVPELATIAVTPYGKLPTMRRAALRYSSCAGQAARVSIYTLTRIAT